jgi:hypothetical protein
VILTGIQHFKRQSIFAARISLDKQKQPSYTLRIKNEKNIQYQKNKYMAKYELGDYVFDPKRFFPDSIFSAVTEVRVNSPKIILQEAAARKKRKKLTRDGKLTILAADHPGRMVTRSGDDPIGMCDRQEYLGQVLRVVTNPDVDGIMATTDVIEDLFIVNHLVKQGGGPSFLDAWMKR